MKELGVLMLKLEAFTSLGGFCCFFPTHSTHLFFALMQDWGSVCVDYNQLHSHCIRARHIPNVLAEPDIKSSRA